MKTKQLLLLLLWILLPLAAWGYVWQDPETRVNYTYNDWEGTASVTGGSYYFAGSPDAKGDITILSTINILVKSSL